MNTEGLEFWKVLCVSTAHLTPCERERLCESRAQYAHREGWGCVLWIGNGKCRAGVPILDDDGDSPGLTAIVQLAWNTGCTYVAFDADADTIDGVPTYE